MKQKQITYGKKLISVSDEVHKGYETATRKFIRNNEKFRKNEVATASVVHKNCVSFEENIEDSLMAELIMKIAAEHLTADEYLIFEKIILSGMSERKYAESVGVSRKTMSYRREKIVLKLRKILGI